MSGVPCLRYGYARRKRGYGHWWQGEVLGVLGRGGLEGIHVESSLPALLRLLMPVAVFWVSRPAAAAP